MTQPWQIVRDFKKRLNTIVTTENKNLNATAQLFVPTLSNIEVSQRVSKVQSLVKQSCEVANESKLPGLNDSAFAFCKNCACASCSNQSAIHGVLDQTSNKSIDPQSIISSYDEFLRLQRQQFILFVDRIMTASPSEQCNLLPEIERRGSHEEPSLDQSITPLYLSKIRSQSLQSEKPNKKLPEIEWHESVEQRKANLQVALASPGKTRSQLVNSVKEKENLPQIKWHGLVEKSNTDLSVSCVPTAKATHNGFMKNDRKVRRTSIADNDANESEVNEGTFVTYFDENCVPLKKQRTDSFDEASNIESFDADFVTFKPIRRSKSGLSVNHTICETEIEADWSSKSRSSKERTTQTVPVSHEKKIVHDLSVILDDKVPVIAIEKMKLTSKSQPKEDCKVLCTRSGRNVKKPGQYWVKTVEKDPLTTTRGQMESTLTSCNKKDDCQKMPKEKRGRKPKLPSDNMQLQQKKSSSALGKSQRGRKQILNAADHDVQLGQKEESKPTSSKPSRLKKDTQTRSRRMAHAKAASKEDSDLRTKQVKRIVTRKSKKTKT